MHKKIAVIASYIEPTMQRHLLDWFESLNIEGITFKLFLGSQNSNIPYASNFKINSRFEQGKYYISNKLTNKIIPDDLQKIQPLLNFKPDLVHILTSNTFFRIEPLLDYLKIPVIVSFRGYDINVFPNESNKNLNATRHIFEKADVLHFISNELMESAIKLGAEPSKSKVIYRSINTNVPIIKKQENTIVISSVGRLVWEKGYKYALEAVALLKKEGFKFKYFIAGDGIDYNELSALTEKIDLTDCVHFLGRLEHTEVVKLLSKTDIYLQPSIKEALSNSLIEASYFKLPVISSKIGGIPEVILDEVSGFLAAPKEVISLTASLRKLVENNELRLKMGESGHQHILNYFSREKEMEKWKNLYFSLL